MFFHALTMEYKGGRIYEKLPLRNYKTSDYEEYRHVYEECFFGLRESLRLKRNCYKTYEELKKNKNNIFV